MITLPCMDDVTTAGTSMMNARQVLYALIVELDIIFPWTCETVQCLCFFKSQQYIRMIKLYKFKAV
jgi:hypothetical protein